MGKTIDRFSAYCVENGIISAEKAPWLVYALEKRVYTLVGMIPICILSFWLAGLWTGLAFLGSFILLRERTNGFHARTPGLCFILSLVTVAGFLLLLPLLRPWLCLCLVAADAIAIFLLAPYKHPNMHLSADEVRACRKSARLRTALLCAGFAVFALIPLPAAGKGLTLGMTMAATLLCIAYIRKEGNPNASTQ